MPGEQQQDAGADQLVVGQLAIVAQFHQVTDDVGPPLHLTDANGGAKIVRHRDDALAADFIFVISDGRTADEWLNLR